MKGKVYFCCIFVSLFLLGLRFSVEAGEDDLLLKIGIKPIKGGKKAPDFCLKNLNGKNVEFKNFRGKVIFLNFWATWCGPCKEEMSSMEALYQDFKKKDFTFLSISVDYEGLKPVKEYIEKNKYTFPVLIDPKCGVLDLYEVKGIPTTFIIDKNGRMIGKSIGPKNWKSQEIISLLNLLIGTKIK
jgi:peroxiredoxin